jgi:hypothetical protein
MKLVATYESKPHKNNLNCSLLALTRRCIRVGNFSTIAAKTPNITLTIPLRKEATCHAGFAI